MTRDSQLIISTTFLIDSISVSFKFQTRCWYGGGSSVWSFNLQHVIWWWQVECKDEWAPQSVTTKRWFVKIKSIQDSQLAWNQVKFIATLRSLMDVSPPLPPPRLLIFRKFSTQDILIPHPPFIKSRKIFQPGHLQISTVTKNTFNISPKVFRYRLSFARISEVIAL